MANDYCGCGSVPTHFCMCRKPAKTYVCGACMSIHSSKPGSHTFFEPRVVDLFDPELQNLRTTYLIEITTAIDQMANQASVEYHNVSAKIEEVYNVQARVLWDQFCKAKIEIEGLWSQLYTTVNDIKKEVSIFDTHLDFTLSPSCIAFLQFVWHPDKSIDFSIRTETEVMKLVDGGSVISLDQILNLWKCAKPQCKLCGEKLKQLKLESVNRHLAETAVSAQRPRPSSLNMQALRKCDCGQLNEPSAQCCIGCRKAQFTGTRTVDSAGLRESVGKTCEHCGAPNQKRRFCTRCGQMV